MKFVTNHKPTIGAILKETFRCTAPYSMIVMGNKLKIGKQGKLYTVHGLEDGGYRTYTRAFYDGTTRDNSLAIGTLGRNVGEDLIKTMVVEMRYDRLRNKYVLVVAAHLHAPTDPHPQPELPKKMYAVREFAAAEVEVWVRIFDDEPPRLMVCGYNKVYGADDTEQRVLGHYYLHEELGDSWTIVARKAAKILEAKHVS